MFKNSLEHSCSRFHEMLGYLELRRVTSPNLGLILGFACYNARLGLVKGLKIIPKL